MKYCKIEDCTKANNKCSECEFSSSCDYPWVAAIWKNNSDLLTPLMPGWVKPNFRENKIISLTGDSDFCIFNVPKKADYVTIQDICVDESARGKGISKQLIAELMQLYDRDVLVKCVKDSSAEGFWAHLGEKIGEEPSKKRVVSIYRVENKHKQFKKEELF